MERFCRGEHIWNSSLTWSDERTFPEFTECFGNTVPVWIPNAFLWGVLPFYLYVILQQETNPIRNYNWNISKRVILFLQVVMCCREYYSRIGEQGAVLWSASVTAPLLDGVTLTLVFVLMELTRLKGFVTSGVLWCYWTLVALSKILPLYSIVLKQGIDDVTESLVMTGAMLGLSWTQFVMHCYAETVEIPPGERGVPSTEPYASFLSKLTLSWANGMVMKGYRTTLQEADIPDLNPRDMYNTVVPLSQANLEKETERAIRLQEKNTPKNTDGSDAASTRPLVSLTRVLMRTFGSRMTMINLVVLLERMVEFAKPLLLKLLVDFVEARDEAAWSGFLLALCFLGVGLLKLVFCEMKAMMSHQLHYRLRTSLIAMIHQKSLKMSSKARKEFTSGEIVNLMAKDSQHIASVCWFFWSIFVLPVDILTSVICLYWVVGNAMIPGLCVVLIMMPLKVIMHNRRKDLHKDQMDTSDRRSKLLTDVLNGIKILKLYSWERAFGSKVTAIRDEEVDLKRKNAQLSIIDDLCWRLLPFLVGMATIWTHVYMGEDKRFDAQTAFVTMALLDILRHSINLMPIFLLELYKTGVSVKRVEKFLNAETLDGHSVTHNPSDAAVVIENGSFTWDSPAKPILKDINLSIPKGGLVAIVGQVGAGKSSLVSAILGEIEKTNGSVNVDGSTAYVPQQAWIQNATVRDNILFGKTLKKEKFCKIVQACALQPDLDMFTAGDKTEIGEKGINLSGGQKQRISLARAIYCNSDIYILDDPLSAVDSHVGKHIFDHVIGNEGALKNKTRILVTHGIQWLPLVDTIIVVADGKVSEAGSYQQLLDHGGAFAQFLRTYLKRNSDNNVEGNEEEILGTTLLERLDSLTEETNPQEEFTENTGLRKRFRRQRVVSESEKHGDSSPVRPNFSRVMSVDEASIQNKKALHSKKSRTFSTQWSHEQIPIFARGISTYEHEADSDPEDDLFGNIIADEAIETGTVELSVVKTYFKAYGFLPIVLTFSLILLNNLVDMSRDIWVTQWTSDTALSNDSVVHVNRSVRIDLSKPYLFGYAATGALNAILTTAMLLIWISGFIKASQIIHSNMIRTVLRCPMSFFDRTPIGRILTRFTHDLSTVDDSVPHTLKNFVECIVYYIVSIVVIVYTSPLFLIIIIPVAAIYYHLKNVYTPTHRQIVRLEPKVNAPIISGFSESLAGVEVIRAFGDQERCIQETAKRVDRCHRCYSAHLSVSVWLAVRIRVIAALTMFAVACLTVYGRHHIGPSMAALTIAYALQFTEALQNLLRSYTGLETSLSSLENVRCLTSESSEAPLITDKRPRPGWPEKGQVELKNFAVRYREGLELVLKGIDLSICPGEKVGIVGRTGAGKSSLTISIFRLIEAAKGKIVIDGEDISKIGLQDLRSRLTILPQEPVLLSGSLRMNLDPLSEHSDSELLVALEHAHLKSYVDTLSEGLHYEVGEGGKNLSVGQRQLICLARSLLKDTKLLILDEATAAVDMETDDLIQATIRREFKDCTVLTIAHRLNTIVDYDKILVLDKGLVKEFDTPGHLLADTSSTFYGMAKAAGLV